MLRHAIYSFVFVMSFTAAQAETRNSYFSVSGILDATLNYDDESLSDVTIDNGFILSFGQTIQENTAVEIAYARYLDTSSFGGLVEAEVNAIEVSALASLKNRGPFFRIGYSHGDLSSRVGNLSQSESEGGLLIGIGADLDLPQGLGAIRVEYTFIDYDNAEADRLTIGTLLKF